MSERKTPEESIRTLCEEFGLDIEEIVSVQIDMEHEGSDMPIMRMTYTGIKVLSPEESLTLLSELERVDVNEDVDES